MTLREFVSIYDGDMLFSVRETVTENETSSENIVISFKNGEHDALKEDLLTREVEKFRVESISKNNGITKSIENVVAIVLAAVEGA